MVKQTEIFSDVFYNLKPQYECEPGWYKLKWRPIKGQTWNLFMMKYPKWTFRFSKNDHGHKNGWGRYSDGVGYNLFIGKIMVMFWVRWNFKVSKDGPLDSKRGPIKIIN